MALGWTRTLGVWDGLKDYLPRVQRFQKKLFHNRNKQRAKLSKSSAPLVSVRGKVERRITRSMSQKRAASKEAKKAKAANIPSRITRCSKRVRQVNLNNQKIQSLKQKIYQAAEPKKKFEETKPRFPKTRSQSRKERIQPKVQPVKNVSQKKQKTAQDSTEDTGPEDQSSMTDAVMSKYTPLLRIFETFSVLIRINLFQILFSY